MYSTYFKELKDFYDHQLSLDEITFILGNNSCDMDSALSSFLLSLGKNIKYNTITYNKSNNTAIFNKNPKRLFLPVLNIKRGTFAQRLDLKYVFDLFKIDENLFWYISDDIFDENKLFLLHKNNNIKTSIILVDHSKLCDEQKFLADYITEIYDHHPENKYEYKNLKNVHIKYPLGSCTTLILLDYFFDIFPRCLIDPLFAVTAILIDTNKFESNFYNNRWVDLDRIVYKRIKSEIKPNEKKMKYKEYYKNIIENKYDIEKNLNLGIEVLLLKDQKHFNWSGINIIWSSLQVPYYKIQEKFGINEIITQMYSYYLNKTKEEVLSQFFITNSNYNEKSRVFTIFNPINIPIDIEELKNSLSFTLKNGFVSINYDNEFQENLKGVIYYIILDKTFTRKNVEPVFKELFTSLICANDLVVD
jgi:inorganic pyrophosphatase/exopolyphosphatase